MKLDILVFAAHPDDAELGCAGTILVHVAQNKKVGVIDLTRGELGTRGTPETRINEALESARILGLSVRENMSFRDAFFKNDEEHQLAVIKTIRKYRPEIVITNAYTDRHIDHGKASELVKDACFLSGLAKIKTSNTNEEPWRPKVVYHFIQNNYIKPDLIIDVTQYWEKKIESIKAFKSQFHDPDSSEPQTFISSPEFLQFIESRAMEFGHAIGVKYGEGFTVDRHIGVKNLFDLL